MFKAPKSPKLTQDERSARTRDALHKATVASLMEVGYANTSTSSIAKRAGLSRGAQSHQYPGKIDLIVAATEDMFNGFLNDIDCLAGRLCDGSLSMDQFLSDIWNQMLNGVWFYSSLEMIVAARGDTELQRRLTPLILELHTGFEAIWRRTFEPCEGIDADPSALFNLAMNMFRGMAVQAVLRPDKSYHAGMMATLCDLLRDKIRAKRK
ncbi:TetR/AcrR family transcriptional regulator [Roseovarius aestuarii]|nr:TetR/AcrR family transcriptional regulator [Roseovarius aestuarii]